MNYITYEVRVYADGYKYWYLDGKRHREDGPAVKCADGSKEWYLNGKRHRKDGPAIEDASGGKSWFLNGKSYSEEEWKKLVNTNSCDGKTVEIDGKKYRLTEI